MGNKLTRHHVDGSLFRIKSEKKIVLTNLINGIKRLDNC
jgi:hypothetical protein